MKLTRGAKLMLWVYGGLLASSLGWWAVAEAYNATLSCVNTVIANGECW